MISDFVGALNINFVPIIALGILILFIFFNTTFNRQQSRLFIIAAAVNTLALIAITLDYSIMSQGKDGASLYWLRRITSFLNFALSPAIGYFLVVVASKIKLSKLWAIPLAVNSVICLISMFFPIVFRISAQNQYGRGALFFLPIATAIFYIGLLLFTNISKYSQIKTLERIFLSVVIVIIILSMVLEIQFGLYFVTWGVAAVSLVFYYLLLNINRFIVDPLTEVFNRAAFEKKTKQLEEKKAYGYVIIDINDFKSINDNYGHESGDKCLKYFGNLLARFLSPCSLTYRIGGDEFACFFKLSNKIKVEKGLERMREEAALNNIYFAYGISHHKPGETMEDLQREADTKMYADKNAMKSQNKTTAQ